MYFILFYFVLCIFTLYIFIPSNYNNYKKVFRVQITAEFEKLSDEYLGESCTGPERDHPDFEGKGGRV